MAALRTAVIGVGYMGRFHAQKFASCRGAKLVAVADTDAGLVDGAFRSCSGLMILSRPQSIRVLRPAPCG